MPTLEILWPSDLVDEPANIPTLILRQQADALADRTGSRLRARVDSSASTRLPWARRLFPDMEFEGATYFRHRLIIVVPALENYEVELLSLSHSTAPYPVVARIIRREEYTQLLSEDQLKEWLRDALASPESRELISTLLSVAT